ncbi:SRK1_1 [Sanghuangporus weigelae]
MVAPLGTFALIANCFFAPLMLKERFHPRRSRRQRSPGLATLKEAFDVTYAVHRAREEEDARRAYRGPSGAGMRGYLHDLNEADEDAEQDQESQVDASKRRSRGRDNLNEGRAGMRDAPRNGRTPGIHSPLAQQALTGKSEMYEAPGSPMQVG